VDVILMDCEMPTLDGLATAAEIRQREGAARHTWIIAMTANPGAAQRNACRAAGMDDFLPKPAAPAMLRAALEKISRQRQRAVNFEIVTANGLAAILPRLIELFLRDAPRRIEEMQAAVDAGDLQALKRAGHTLAGSAANLGAGEVAQLSAALEAQARQGTTAGAAERLETLRRAFERAHAELSRAAEA
jgi:DNA-binding response OmpR family regulator